MRLRNTLSAGLFAIVSAGWLAFAMPALAEDPPTDTPAVVENSTPATPASEPEPTTEPEQSAPEPVVEPESPAEPEPVVEPETSNPEPSTESSDSTESALVALAPPPEESGSDNGNCNVGVANGNINGNGNVGEDVGNDNGNCNVGVANGNGNGNQNDATAPTVVDRVVTVQGVTLEEHLLVSQDGQTSEGTFTITDGATVAEGTISIQNGNVTYNFVENGIDVTLNFVINPDGSWTYVGSDDCYKCGGTGNKGAYNGLANTSDTSGNNNYGFFNGNGNCGLNNGNNNVGIGNGNFNGNCSDTTGLYGNNNGNNNNGVFNGNFNGTGTYVRAIIEAKNSRGSSPQELCQPGTPKIPAWDFVNGSIAKKLKVQPVVQCCVKPRVAVLDPKIEVKTSSGKTITISAVKSCEDGKGAFENYVLAFDFRLKGDIKLAQTRGYCLYDPKRLQLLDQCFLPVK